MAVILSRPQLVNIEAVSRFAVQGVNKHSAYVIGAFHVTGPLVSDTLTNIVSVSSDNRQYIPGNIYKDE